MADHEPILQNDDTGRGGASDFSEVGRSNCSEMVKVRQQTQDRAEVSDTEGNKRDNPPKDRSR